MMSRMSAAATQAAAAAEKVAAAAEKKLEKSIEASEKATESATDVFGVSYLGRNSLHISKPLACTRKNCLIIVVRVISVIAYQ